MGKFLWNFTRDISFYYPVIGKYYRIKGNCALNPSLRGTKQPVVVILREAVDMGGKKSKPFFRMR